MTTLYRKYRPQNFRDVVGQETVVTTLTNQINLERVAQAYIFAGPRGTGKTSLARILAKALNCTSRAASAAEPCGECASCQDITRFASLDVNEIDAASHTGVDNVRENIIETARFQPAHSRYKVFIIDEVHMLSTSAFNALLKILEEPPAHVIFILATTEIAKLPATVVSRCQRFIFRKLERGQMRERLNGLVEKEHITLPADALERIITLSEGCLRDAESLLGQVAAWAKEDPSGDLQYVLPAPPYGVVLAYVASLADKDAAAALTVVRSLPDQGITAEYFAASLLDVLRAVLFMNVMENVANEYLAAFNTEEQDSLKKIRTRLGLARTAKLLDRVLARKYQIKTASIPELPLELLAVEEVADETATTTQSAPVAAPTVAEKKTAPAREPASSPPVTAAPAEAVESHDETIAVGALALPAVQTRWSEVVERLGASSHSLTFILKMCSLLELQDHKLTLEVPYSFHQEKLLETKNKRLLETTLFELFKTKVLVHCTTRAAAPPSAPAEAVFAIAAEFGGEVVN